MPLTNPYKRLGLPDNADFAEVKKRFRELSMEKHPDKGGNENEYKKILEAYKRIEGGYRVPKRKTSAKTGKPKLKMTENDTYIDVVLSLEDGFRGCAKTIQYGCGDSVRIVFKPRVENMETVGFEKMGKKNGFGKRTNLFATVHFSMPSGFSFINHFGKQRLVYDLRLNKGKIPRNFSITVDGVCKTITLPRHIRNGMYLVVRGFGYYCLGERDDLFVRVTLSD